MSNRSPARWITIITLLFGIFLLSYYLAARFFPQNSKKTSDSVPNSQTTNPTDDASKANITLLPATGTLKVGGEPIRVRVQAGGAKIQAADVVISYDPRYIKVEKIKSGKNFPMLIKQSVANGRISVSVSISPSLALEAVTGEMFTYEISGVAPTNKTVMDIVASETFAALNGNNLLHNISGGTYTVTQ